MQHLRHYYGIEPLEYHVNGSVAINGHGADLDLVCLMPWDEFPTMHYLIEHNWQECGGVGEYDALAIGDYFIVRNGLINLIMVRDSVIYDKWEKAMRLAKDIREENGGGEMSKIDRACIYRVVVDGELR